MIDTAEDPTQPTTRDDTLIDLCAVCSHQRQSHTVDSCGGGPVTAVDLMAGHCLCEGFEEIKP